MRVGHVRVAGLRSRRGARAGSGSPARGGCPAGPGPVRGTGRAGPWLRWNAGGQNTASLTPAWGACCGRKVREGTRVNKATESCGCPGALLHGQCVPVSAPWVRHGTAAPWPTGSARPGRQHLPFQGLCRGGWDLLEGKMGWVEMNSGFLSLQDANPCVAAWRSTAFGLVAQQSLDF